MGCCGPKCSKAFVIFFNILFWVSGCAFVGLGACLICDPMYSHFYTLFSLDKFPQIYVTYTAFASFGLGGFILFVGFFGCCGALQDSKCMLGTYVFCVILVLIVEVGLALIILYCRFYFPSEIGSELRKKIIYEYGQPDKQTFTSAMNFTQYHLECCGMDSFSDYAQSKFANRSITDNNRVPKQCCVLDKEVLDWGSELEDYQNPREKNARSCQSPDPSLFQSYLNEYGCWVKMQEWYFLRNLILAATCGGLAFIDFLAVTASVCLFRNIGEEV